MNQRRRKRPGLAGPILGDLYDLDRVAFVEAPGLGRPVRVRFRFDGEGAPWRCDACGATQLPTCRHTQIVADRLIRDLLDDTEDLD